MHIGRLKTSLIVLVHTIEFGAQQHLLLLQAQRSMEVRTNFSLSVWLSRSTERAALHVPAKVKVAFGANEVVTVTVIGFCPAGVCATASKPRSLSSRGIC